MAAAALLALAPAPTAAQRRARRARGGLLVGSTLLHELQVELPPSLGAVQTSAALVTERGEWVSPSAVPAGARLLLVCGFVNSGDAPVNVSEVMGLATDEYNNMRAVFELPARAVGQVADRDRLEGEVSVHLPFTVPSDFRRLDPQNFAGFPYRLRLSAVVFYDSDRHATAFFNETITIVAPKAAVLPSAATALQWVLPVLGFVAFALMLLDAVSPRVEDSFLGGNPVAEFVLNTALGLRVSGLATAAEVRNVEAAEAKPAAAPKAQSASADDDAQPSILATAASPRNRKGGK